MRAFYDALFARGQPAPAALRAAQAELRRSPRWASPYYWAALYVPRGLAVADAWPGTSQTSPPRRARRTEPAAAADRARSPIPSAPASATSAAPAADARCSLWERQPDAEPLADQAMDRVAPPRERGRRGGGRAGVCASRRRADPARGAPRRQRARRRSTRTPVSRRRTARRRRWSGVMRAWRRARRGWSRSSASLILTLALLGGRPRAYRSSAMPWRKRTAFRSAHLQEPGAAIARKAGNLQVTDLLEPADPSGLDGHNRVRIA